MAYLSHAKEAQQHYESAFYLFHRTYALAKDPKLLIGIIDRLAASLEAGMNAILTYDRELQLIPAYGTSFANRYTLFQNRSAKRYRLPPEQLGLLITLRETLQYRQQSPTEFRRGSRLVIGDQHYHLKTIAPKEIPSYLHQAKSFLQEVDKILKIERKE